jgi:regulator of protease activity HflC (stomatin/prohibitin superfamily)
MVRAKIGKMDLGEVQANQTTLINTVKKLVEGAQDHWGIEVTRAEILAVNLDAATRADMMKQLNAHVLHR